MMMNECMVLGAALENQRPFWSHHGTRTSKLDTLRSDDRSRNQSLLMPPQGFLLPPLSPAFSFPPSCPLPFLQV